MNSVIRKGSDIHLHVVFDVFLATKAELTSCDSLQGLKYLLYGTWQKKFAKAQGQILRENSVSEREGKQLNMFTEWASIPKGEFPSSTSSLLLYS